MTEEIITKFDYNAPVILTYFFICLIILIIDKIMRGKFSTMFFSSGRNDSLLNPLTYFKLVSHSLGHSNWDHLYSNFLKILLIGPLIEEKYGSYQLLIMMIITSLIIGVINRLFSKNRILGASGLAYMLIVLCSFVNIEDGKIKCGFEPSIMTTTIFELFSNIEAISNEVNFIQRTVGSPLLLIRNISIVSSKKSDNKSKI